jgi:hypothetical protein
MDEITWRIKVEKRLSNLEALTMGEAAGAEKRSTEVAPGLTRKYLGDGLYHAFDGYQHILIAPREDGEHYVCIDEPTLNAFFMRVEKIHGVKISVDKV